MKQLTSSEILEKVMERLGYNAYGLATALNYRDSSAIYHVLKGRNTLSKRMIKGLIDLHPALNLEYLQGKSEKMILKPNEAYVQTLQLTGDKEARIEQIMIDRLTALESRYKSVDRKLNQIIKLLK